MKKNRMMRLASVLLVLTLLSTSVISGTFAKYTTSASGSDSARVAYWGFDDDGVIEINDLFLTAYDTDKDDKSVMSATKVIAPGTKNQVTFTFNYDEAGGSSTPEVDYMFEVSTNGSNCAADIQSNTNIVWTLDGEQMTWNELIYKLECMDGSGFGGGCKYEAGHLPVNFADSHTIGWEWKIGDTDEENERDTAMGNKATLDEVKLVITITATQID